MNLLEQQDQVWKRALEIFDRSEKCFENDVETVREWMKTQKHLPEVMEDVKIKNFLILNKCSIEKTKERIDMYYTIRSLIPDFYDDSNPKLPHLLEYMDVGYSLLHPVLTKEMYRVFFLKMKMPHKCMPRLTAIQVFNLSEIRLYEDCMMGEVLVFDMNDFSFEDITKINLAVLSKVLSIYKNVYSFRLKTVYIINSTPYLDYVLSILKFLLKPKIFNRIHVHQDFEILNQLFSKDVLPKDYGGEGPSLEELNEIWKVKFHQYQSRFDRLDKLRVNEILRPQKLDNDELLGFYGNFKKLNVD